MRHLFITQDYPPDLGGMARRHVELVRRFGNATESMEVSTVQLDNAAGFDSREPYSIYRQPFHFREANRFNRQLQWSRWLVTHARNRVDVIHCGNIRPAGYPTSWANMRLKIPYIVYVNGGDLLRERQKIAGSSLKRNTARRILGNASGIAATSEWVAGLTREVMEQAGVRTAPPVSALGLGTDPAAFSSSHATGELRRKWNLGDEPVLLTVARLVPHKGQDTVIRAMGKLKDRFPDLRYVLAGEGVDESRLRSIARDAGVSERVVFAGAVDDSELPDAYASSTIYVGASRIDNVINAEGYGISFLEASASGLPVVAGDSGGVRSAVRDGETGLVIAPTDVDAWADAIGSLLDDQARRKALGSAGRNA
ncbi:MAG TPA: glycosyltransferase family 4 protein, partial [Gemmatimonadaceae bacterium]